MFTSKHCAPLRDSDIMQSAQMSMGMPSCRGVHESHDRTFLIVSSALQALHSHAAAILEYSLEDIEDGDADSVRQLQGVPLLLLPSTVHVIGRSGGGSVFVLNSQEQQLLSSQPDLLVMHQHLSSDTWSR